MIIKLRLTLLFIINSIFLFNLGQKQEQKICDSIKTIPKLKYKYFISVDIFDLIKSLYTNQTKLSTKLKTQILKSLESEIELGYEYKSFNNIGWKMNGKGMYYKLGINYLFKQDNKNKFNTFYTGAKLGYSKFDQKTFQYPLHFYQDRVEYKNFSFEKPQYFWIEFNLGARIIFYKNYFLSSELRSNVLINFKSIHSIESMFIPGIGIKKNLFNFYLFNGIGYQF